MEEDDFFDAFDGYPELLRQLTNVSPKQMLLIYFYHDDYYSYNLLEWLRGRDEDQIVGLNTELKRTYGASLKLMEICTDMKEVPWIFRVETFPSFLLLDSNLKVLDKFSIKDFMGGSVRLLLKSKKAFGVYPPPPYSEIQERLEKGLRDFHPGRAKKQKTMASDILKRLQIVISYWTAYMDNWRKECPTGKYWDSTLWDC